MSYRDREIMSRWNEGETTESIAKVLRMKPASVSTVVDRYRN